MADEQKQENLPQIEQLLRDSAGMKESIEKLDTIPHDIASVCASVDKIEKNSKQQFAGMMGIIAALIGQKFIATPWYIDLAVILGLFSGATLATSLGIWWKQLTKGQRFVRFIGSALMLSSSITQIFIYEPGQEPAPLWFAPLMNGWLIALSIALMYVAWEQTPKIIRFRHKACK